MVYHFTSLSILVATLNAFRHIKDLSKSPSKLSQIYLCQFEKTIKYFSSIFTATYNRFSTMGFQRFLETFVKLDELIPKLGNCCSELLCT